MSLWPLCLFLVSLHVLKLCSVPGGEWLPHGHCILKDKSTRMEERREKRSLGPEGPFRPPFQPWAFITCPFQ